MISIAFLEVWYAQVLKPTEMVLPTALAPIPLLDIGLAATVVRRRPTSSITLRK